MGAAGGWRGIMYLQGQGPLSTSSTSVVSKNIRLSARCATCATYIVAKLNNHVYMLISERWPELPP